MPRRLLLAAALAGLLAAGACSGSRADDAAEADPVADAPVADDGVAATAAPATSALPTTTSTTAAPQGPVTVLVVGDSVMVQIADALAGWAARNPGQMEVMTDAHVGCGTTRHGFKRYEVGVGDAGAVCATWADPVDPLTAAGDTVSWVTWIEAYRPDVVVSMASLWDAIDRQVPQLGDQWYRPGDPPYDDYVRTEYAEALSILAAQGTEVAWLTTPYVNHPGGYSDPARIDQVLAVVLPLVEALPHSRVIDYRGWLGPSGGPRDLELRSDGAHITPDRLDVVADWLAPQLVAAGLPHRDRRLTAGD